MELVARALSDNPPRDVLMRPAIRDPVCHDGRDRQRRRNGRAFKVLRLPSRVLWESRDGHVESGEAGKAAEDEEREKNVVELGANSDRECGCGGGDTE